MDQPPASGFWNSEISANDAAAGSVKMSELRVHQDALWFLESRPEDKGRTSLKKITAAGEVQTALAAPWNLRTRVHEYGGGAWCPAEDGVFFVHDGDKKIYRLINGGEPDVFAAAENIFFADLHVSGGWLFCVEEDHSAEEVKNILTAYRIKDRQRFIICSNYDFVSNPRLSPDGGKLVWIAWNHPCMPWDGCELLTAGFEDGQVSEVQRLAGGNDESVFQPEWLDNDRLVFINDASGWWNLWIADRGGVRPLCAIAAEFGQPAWIFGMRTYSPADVNTLAGTYFKDGRWHLYLFDLISRQLRVVGGPYSDINYPVFGGGSVYFLGGGSDRTQALIKYDHAELAFRELYRPAQLRLTESEISQPEAVEFESADAAKIYALYYPAHNSKNTAAGNKPPMILRLHGGPTAMASTTLDLRIQYWTSRGFAYLDLNYSGSTGYGRAYRNRLNAKWGEADVKDARAAAAWAGNKGLCDPRYIFITGGSAGGFTALASLTDSKLFRAASCWYGVSDLEMLVKDTHKFESRYLDKLVGKLPEDAQMYWRRSPVYNVDRIDTPVIFFQGKDDKVVPPAQTEKMVLSMTQKGSLCKAVFFEGEGHGFRNSRTIETCLEEELKFFQERIT